MPHCPLMLEYQVKV